MISWFNGEPFTHLSLRAQWCLLILLTVVAIGVLQLAQLPAALLLGAMVAGILLETGGASLRMPPALLLISQAVIGCMVARVITPQILKIFLQHAPLFMGIMLAVISSSVALGWILSRLRLFPGTTAVWGLLPGAASVMMIMAESFGADARLVAFMQYLRVVFVAITASLIAHFWFHTSAHAAIVWFPAVDWLAFAETLVFIALCIALAVKSKISGGAILIPIALGALLQDMDWLRLELPRWLLGASFIVLGCNIGLRFTREILTHAMRTLPQTVISILLLMAFCGGLGWVLVVTAGIDPLTAYLATSPGGVDSAAIIAASSKVDLAFVMAMQVTRLLILLFIGPSISRWIAKRV